MISAMKSKARRTIRDPKQRRSFWQRHVASYLRSGCTISDYCESAGVSQFTLRDWVAKFRLELGEEWIVQQKTFNARLRERATGDFLQVQILDEPVVSTDVSSALRIVRLKIMELRTPAGFSIGLEAEIEVNELVHVLTCLRVSGC